MPDLKTRNLLVPQLVFVVFLIVSVAGWQFARNTLNSQSLSRFEQDANHLHEQIEARFDTYAQVLRGGVGLHNASDDVSREDWKTYVDGLKLPRYFPAIRGVGFSAWVGGRENVGEHEEAVKAEGFPNYAIRPAGRREQYSSVIYLEPFEKGNKRALGFDLFTEDIRRTAMEKARDTGEPALSGKLQLLKEVMGEDQSGFILFMPVYHSQNGIPTSVEERRNSLLGFVMSPFLANDLMKGILRPGRSHLNFQIYDGALPSDDTMLYDGAKQFNLNQQADPAKFEVNKTITIAGRLWTIHYATNPSFIKATDSALPWVLLVTGTLLSLLMAIVAWMLLSTRMRVVQRTRELRKQSDINSFLLENLAEGVVACDADMKDVLMNRKARDWYQQDPSREVDTSWTKRLRMLKSDGKTPFAPGTSPLFRAVAGVTIESEEICIVTSGQEPRFVLVTGGPLPDIDGQKSGAVLSLRDITEYRLAKSNVERQQKFLADVIDNIPNLVSARDREGNHVLANRAYSESFYGMSPEALVNELSRETASRMCPDADEMRQAMAVIDEGASLDYVSSLTLLDGQQRWFRVGKLPIRSNQSAESVVLTVASDITELKISEERIRTMNQELEGRVLARTTSLKEANQKLAEATQVAQAANQAKSSFLAAMSHEIRTPMNGVVGMVEVLMNESRNNELRSSLQMVLDSAFSLLGIIDDILDFSKIEAGQFELENTKYNLTELVESVLRAAVPLARKSNCTIDLYIDPAMPHQVLVDVTRFRQLLTNLLGNAVKFSGMKLERSGHVEVRVSALQGEPTRVRLEVVDNGVGISPEAQERIFDSFVQAESSTTRRFGGSGLGLSICKRIVEMMQGEIQVESETGIGSCFTVTLPLAEVSAEPVNNDHEDISGVDCVLLQSSDYNCADIRTYLMAADARVHQVADYGSAASVIHGLDGPAVVLCSADHLMQPTATSEKPVSSESGHVVLSREESTLGISIRRVSTTHADNTESISAVVVDCNALRRKSLMEAVAIAIGRASPEVLHAYAEVNTLSALVPLSVEDAMDAGRCILVVEDDSVNRMVIKRQLTILGQTAEFAENGGEALKMLQKGRYGLVLTDLHMPVMDGYTMTRTIRDREQEGERIPVVALTANALSGEPRRAADAGVDGYLTKPLQLSTLKNAVSQYFEQPDTAGMDSVVDPDVHSEVPVNAISIFDPDVLQQLLGDDMDIRIECLQEFQQSLQLIGNELLVSIRNEEWDSVDELAHRLKSSSLSTGTLQIWNLCKQIESARLGGHQRRLADHANEMRVAIEKADAAIARFVADNAPGIRKAS